MTKIAVNGIPCHLVQSKRRVRGYCVEKIASMIVMSAVAMQILVYYVHLGTMPYKTCINMMTSPSVTSEFPAQRPVTRTFAVFLKLRPNKRLSKQS